MSKDKDANKFVRTEAELDLMRQSGQITAKALKKSLENIKVGITLAELDQIAEQEIVRLGGQPSFKKVPGFYWATCINLNDGVVHGIPHKTKIQAGDKVSVDLGVVYQGWYTDVAWSVIVGQDQEKQKFLDKGAEALWRSVKQAVEGNTIGDISFAIQDTIEGAGYSVIKSLSGHGVGRDYHEEPEVPGYGKKGQGLKLKRGMTIAIEVMYAKGSGEVYQAADGWTIASVDQSLTGLFEMTVIVGKEKGEVITDFRKV